MMTFQDIDFLFQGWIIHGYLHQKAVQLGFGKLIRSFLLHRVLGGEDRVKFSHPVSSAVNTHLTLFHHFKEGGLRLGRSTVYFVHKYHIGKYRAAMKIELICFHIENRSPQHIARHKVRSELNAAKVSINQTGGQAGKQCFCYTGHPFYQYMPIGKNGCKYQVYSMFLPHYDRSDL